MTDRDEQRAKCLEAQIQAARNATSGYSVFQGEYITGDIRLIDVFTAAFDSLNGTARVCPIEATEEMLNSVPHLSEWLHHDLKADYRRMSATGDLTNPPEKKP